MKSATRTLGVTKKIVAPLVAAISMLVVGFGVYFAVHYFKAGRLRHEQETLEYNYPRLSQEAMQPLFDTELVWEMRSLKKCSPLEPLAVFLFAPDPSSEFEPAMMNEICQLQGPGRGGIVNNVAVLFAPSPTSTSWSLVAKLWLARCVEGKPANDVQNLAMELVGSKPSNTKLKSTWNLIRPDVKAKVEAMLKKNREIAKKFDGTTYIFHDAKGANYQIRNGGVFSSLLDQYYLANPARRRRF